MQIGPYRVLGELGRGGMGVVYRAHDPALDREVALKVLTILGADASDLLRFRREAQAMARLRHPSIVGIHGMGSTAQGLPYLVMDLVEGESLAARVARDGPLPEAEAIRAFEALGRALEHAHARGVLHRDLKPHNVLAERDALVLTDFGLAALVTAETRLTRSGDAMGTPAYMAPEQALGERGRIGPATDVYGLGATLFHALTGAPPFCGATPLEVLEAVVKEPPPDPRALRPGLDAALVQVVLVALAKEPSSRYPTAEAFAAALAALRPQAPRRRGRAERGGARLLLLGAPAAVALLAAGVGVGRATVAPSAPAAPAAPAPATHVADVASPAVVAPAGEAGSIAWLSHHLTAYQRGIAGDAGGARALYDELLARSPDDAATLVARGVLAREGGAAQREAARRDLTRVRALAPRSGEPLAQLALLAIDERDAAAAELVEAALRLEPGCVAALHARALLAMGDPDRAHELFREALAANPTSLPVLIGLARVEARRGDRTGAIATLRRAVAATPWSALPRRELAQQLEAAGDVEAAAQACAELRALWPADAQGFVLGAKLAAARGRSAEAVELGRAAVIREPESVTARIMLASALLLDRQPAEAVRHLEGLSGRDPVAAPFLALALLQSDRRPEAYTVARAAGRERDEPLLRAIGAMFEEQEPARTLADFDAALRRSPGVPWLWLSRAKLRRALGDAAGANADLDELITARADPEALLLRARWARDEGRRGDALDLALACARELREDDPLAQAVRALVVELGTARQAAPSDQERIALAAERVGAGATDEALAALAPVLRADPANPLARLVRARAYLALDEPGAARVELDGLASVASGSAWTHASRAELLARLHDGQAALAEARSALRLDPTLGLAHRVLADVLLTVGQPVEAQRVTAAAAALDLPEARPLRTREAMALRKLEDALAASRDATRRGAGPELLAQRALTLIVLGRLDEADALLAAGWDRVPAMADLFGARSELRLARGDLEGAAADSDLALRARPGRADLALQLVGVHQRRGDLPAAQRLVAELARRFGEAEWLVFARARVLAQAGDLDGARREARAVLASARDRPGIREEVERFLADLDQAERGQRR